MEEEALEEFGLDLDSPELAGMDGGDVWEYLEYLRKEEGNHEQKVDSDETIAGRQ